MIKFSDFLTEAKVSQKNLNRVADVFKRIFEKELNTKLFRFGGPRGISETKSGIGILYFYNKTKAVRLNYSKGEIKSITMWNDFKLGKKGDRTIDLGGIGLLEAGKKLFEILKSNATGKVELYPELTESLLTEAKRIKPSEFVVLIQNNIDSNEDLSSLSWDTITSIALNNDVQIPTAVRKETRIPGTKGKNSRFDLTKLAMGDVSVDIDKPTKNAEPTYFIKITTQDTESKKFLSVKGDKKAEEMLGKIQTAVSNPDTKKEMKDPNTLFGHMSNLAQVVCRGVKNSLVVVGGAGVGKSFVIEQTINEEGLKKNQDWFHIKGKITTASLYQKLFMHRKGDLLVFDDADSVWGDQDAANILKAALDSYDKRTISWYSSRTVNVSKMSPDDREEMEQSIDNKLETDPSDPKIKYPSEFDYDGRIIFISNLPMNKMDPAVLNRSLRIDMTLTTEQIFTRIKGILPKLGSPSVPIDIKEEILEFLMKEDKKGKLDKPSMRTYVNAEDLYRSGLENWKEMLEYAA